MSESAVRSVGSRPSPGQRWRNANWFQRLSRAEFEETLRNPAHTGPPKALPGRFSEATAGMVQVQYSTGPTSSRPFHHLWDPGFAGTQNARAMKLWMLLPLRFQKKA
jgi:hypothetical protein